MLLLVFTMADVKYGIPLEEVEYVAEDINYVDTATASGHIRGTTILRGEVIPVYNLALRFGYEAAKNSNIVTFQEELILVLDIEILLQE